jgi:glycosyltransferase involved in cell wall biosynthesis
VLFDFQGSLTEEMIDHRFLRRDSAFYQPLRRLEQWIDRTSAAILTSSAHAERLLIEQFGCAPTQVHVLPDCVDTDFFRPAATFDPAAQAALRAQLGIPAQHRLIVYLGLLAEYQGTGLLLEAMPRILAQQPNVSLLLMGFPGVAQYRQRAAELGVAHAVTFTGRIPYHDAPRYIALGDVAVGPKLSLSEGAGKLLNYMAAGLPTVAFDTPVAREYLGQDGYLARRGDVDDLAGHLLTALTAPSAVAQGERLRRRAMQLFGWDQAGQMIVETYRALVGSRAQHAPSKSMPAAQ